MPLWQSLILFGVPGTLLLFGTYLLVPPLVGSGIPLIWAWTLVMVASITVPAIIVVVVFFTQPGIDFEAFKTRFRLVAIPKKQWKWLPLAFVAIAVLSFALEWTQPLIKDLLPQQPIVPELFDDPYATVGEGNQEATFFGRPMEGNFWLVPFWIIWVVVIVTSEEILWRGYALPRMEAAYGSWAFLVNGLLWNLPFHTYTFWNVFTDMPMYLIIPFVATKTKSTWGAILLHVSLLMLALVYLIPGVLGGQ